MHSTKHVFSLSKAVCLILCLILFGGLIFQLQPAQAAPTSQSQDSQVGIEGIYRGVSTAVQFDISPPLRDIPPAELDPEALALFEDRDPPSGLEGPLGPQDIDPSVQISVGPNEIPAPIISFDGFDNQLTYTPPDPVGDVGPDHYVAMSNVHFAVFDKSGNILYGPVPNNTLWAGFGGACQNENSGDPIVVYDQLADRWMLTQFTSAGPTYYNCVALSVTGDPTGLYYRWAFSTGANFPDYPKYGVWPDAYYISTREFGSPNGIGAYALNRDQMLAGNPTPQVISFLAQPGYNVGDGLLPADIDGSALPPAGSPQYFMGSMDDGGPYGAPQDALTLWKFVVDWDTPGNSTFTLTDIIQTDPFDSMYPCSPGSRNCIPQPGTTQKIDILSYRQRPLWRLAYRNFGTHESLVTNQSVEAAPNMAGIRWYEVRDPNGTPFIYQQGTYAPGITDGIHRWMGSIAMDSAGNMALGYSASNGIDTYPSVWYTGRLVTDPLGTMPQGEGVFVNGSGSQLSTGSRWGDYTSMNIDPVDDCTFWYINEYYPATSSTEWYLRIGAFMFPSCGTDDFSMTAEPASQSICAPDPAVYNLTLEAIRNFTDSVTLSTLGQPAGTTVDFSLNPVTPPGSSLLTISNTISATVGSYAIDVIGVATTRTHTVTVGLEVFNSLPGQPELLAPADGSIGLPQSPTFSWTAATQGASYDLEIATDRQFSNVVVSVSDLMTTTHTITQALNINSMYFWRVKADNTCGSSYSPVYSFLTQAPVGACPAGTTAVTLFSDDLESGATGWTHGGDTDTWTLSDDRTHSGANAFFADDGPFMNDQWLVSPEITLPEAHMSYTLQFWNYQSIQDRATGGCYDGAMVEVSTDGGVTWTQADPADLLSDPYDGNIVSGSGNPLEGHQAWCGDPQDWLSSIVALDDYAGETVQLRFRMGTNNSISHEGWYIDDVTLQSCQLASSLGPDSSLDAAPGSSVTHAFTLLNGQGTSDTYSLEVSGYQWPTAILSANPVTLTAGASTTVLVQVDVPALFVNGLHGTDAFTLTAQPENIPIWTPTTVGATRAVTNPSVEISPATQALTSTAESMVTYVFTVTNTGNYTDVFTLTVSGTWTATLPGGDSTGLLAAGQSAVISLTVAIPAEAPGGSADTTTLTAVSTLDSLVSASATATTNVAEPWFRIYLPHISR